MEKVYENITKICSFYVSDWHLTTMLLPYINKEIEHRNKISTILENSLVENIKVLAERITLDNKSDILNINWNSMQNIKNEEIEKIIDNSKENNTIIINGSNTYIKNANKAIEKYLQMKREAIKDKKIKIINCYKVTSLATDLDSILKLHDKVLNTTGEKKIEEVFEGYKKMDII